MISGADTPREKYGNKKKNGDEVSPARKEHFFNPMSRMRDLIPDLLDENPYRNRPCEERSDEAIQGQPSGSGLLRPRLAMTAGATTFWAVHI
jgi:hypothetical protein